MKRYTTPAEPDGTHTIQVQVRHQCPIVSAGLRAILSVQPDIHISAEAHGALSPEDNCVLVADYESSVSAVRECLRGASDNAQPVPVLVLTYLAKAGAIRYAIESGVRGYVIQGGAASEVIEGVRLLSRGRFYLSPKAGRLEAEWLRRTPLTQREAEVLQVLASGSSDKAIARKLGIEVGTVKSHMRQLFQKLDVATRTQVVIKAMDLGLYDFPSMLEGEPSPAARGLADSTFPNLDLDRFWIPD
jgi:DNA-binding NarL/FixJ family response regulator